MGMYMCACLFVHVYAFKRTVCASSSALLYVFMCKGAHTRLHNALMYSQTCMHKYTTYLCVYVRTRKYVFSSCTRLTHMLLCLFGSIWWSTPIRGTQMLVMCRKRRPTNYDLHQIILAWRLIARCSNKPTNIAWFEPSGIWGAGDACTWEQTQEAVYSMFPQHTQD